MAEKSSSGNRGRYVVDSNGNWKLYTRAAPGVCEMLGTITRDGGEMGALVRTEAGIYSMLNDRVFRALDQQKVKAALGLVGTHGGARRTPQDADGPVSRSNYSLDDFTREAARDADRAAGGKGDVSRGLRLLARMYRAGQIKPE